MRTTPEESVCRAVAGDGHEVDLAGNRDAAHQVGEEEHGALQHADHEEVAARVVGADLACRARRRACAGPPLGDQGRLAARVAHGPRSIPTFPHAGRRPRRSRGRRRRGRASPSQCGAGRGPRRRAGGTGDGATGAARSASCWTTRRRSAGGSSARRSSRSRCAATRSSRRARRPPAHPGPLPRRATAPPCVGRSGRWRWTSASAVARP